MSDQAREATMQTVNAILSPAGLSIGGTVIAEAPPLNVMLTVLGMPGYRTEEIHDRGKLWRKFVILDQLGICLLYDVEVERVIDVHFCFAPSKSPSSPKGMFSGLLFVNGVRLVSCMRERLLPLDGEFHFSKQGGWTATSNAVFLRMRTLGKRLQAVDVSFLRRPRFACERK